MNIDSQRLEIEQLRRKLIDWQSCQWDFDVRVGLTVEACLPASLWQAMGSVAIARQLAQHSRGDALRRWLYEQTFMLVHDGESHLQRFQNGPGRAEDALRQHYLRALAATPLALWRVPDTEAGSSLTLAPWDGTSATTVRDRRLSLELQPDSTLLTRLIPLPAGPVLGHGVLVVKPELAESMPHSVKRIQGLLGELVSQLLNGTSAPSEDPALAASPATSSTTESIDKPSAATASSSGSNRPDDRRNNNNKRSPSEPDSKSRDRASARPASTAAQQGGRIDRDRLLDRVRKLFAMAQQAEASPHEAEIALRRCESLMARYGITEADLETSAFGHTDFTTGRSVPMHVKYLAVAIARLHDVLFVVGRGGYAEFRGYEVDTHVARLSLDYLRDAIERALTARKRTGDVPAGRTAAYDYRLGFAKEVGRRIAELVEERERLQQANKGVGKALAIRKREIVERECGNDLGRSSFRGRGVRDSTAHAAGHADGSQVSLENQVEGPAAHPTLSKR